ncbi:hypothetical protein A3K72_02550 [Candidatus Woesearchaeota archaeon RBG_13_36_6]|nr:MAG: hypothetical protein A3K72_02550 [Candidatus Woesearchaeota archaeon RBG_13_36_6]
MGIEDLETKLKTDSTRKYLLFRNIINSINKRSMKKHGEKYGDVFAFFMSMAHHLNELGFTKAKDYAVVGGYGTALYLTRFGERILSLWRGSHDIDMVTLNQELVGAIFPGHYPEYYSGKSTLLPDKMSIHLGDYLDDDVTECSVDCWVPIEHAKPNSVELRGRLYDQKFFDELIIIPILKIPICVPPIYSLIKIMSKGGDTRPQDLQDMIDLTTVLAAHHEQGDQLVQNVPAQTSVWLRDTIYGNNSLPEPTIASVKKKSDHMTYALDRVGPFIEEFCKAASELELK